MNGSRLLIALTTLNIGVLLLGIAQHAGPSFAQPADAAPAPVLRARAFELVDGQGRVRATLAVLPATTSAAGVPSEETVLLRLITERGRPSVKIGASEQGAGMSLAGPTGTRDSYAILEANATTSSLKLRAENGREQLLRP
jgi:hypothetical protein